MAELYNFPQELAPHQVNEIRPELVGIHAKNPGLTSNSPSRSTMMSSHVSQHLIVKGAEIPLIISGTEVEYSKFTTSDRVPFDCRVVQIIDRYPKGITENSLGFNPERLVIICNDETGEYDVIPIGYHKSYHQYFGYKNKLSELVEGLTPGTRLGEDTPLADTPANISRFYTHTVNLNCMLASPDMVAEDAVLICEDVLDKFEYRVYEKRTVSVGAKRFPVAFINTGDKTLKSFYEIGEYTADDGAIMWLRDYTDGLSPVTMSDSAIRKIDYTFDTPIYARQGHQGRIVDIKVFGNSDLISALPVDLGKQFEKYRQANKRYCESLLECERKIYKEAKQKFGTTTPSFSGALSNMLVAARAHTDNVPGKPLQLLMNKNPLDEYFIEFTVEYVLVPTMGGKMTGDAGDPI